MASLPSRQPAPLRKTLVDDVAAWLRGEIVSGAFGSTIPSLRSLRTQLQVGRSTLQAAFRLLEKEGWIAVEPRRRAVPIRREETQRRDKVGWLDWEMVQNFSSRRTRDILFLQTMIKDHGYQFELFSSNTAFFKHKHRNRIDLFADPRVGCWLLVNQPEAIQREVMDRGLPALVVGTRCPGVALPWIDLNWQAVARHAGGSAMARGHRHLAFVCSKAETADHLAALAGIREAVAAHAEGYTLEIIRHAETTRSLLAHLQRLLTRVQPRPTVLIVKEAYAAITLATALLSQTGIRFPADCSLIALEAEAAFRHMTPEITRYEVGDNVLWRQLAAGVERIGRLPADYHYQIHPSAVEGATLVAPPPSRPA